MEEGQLYLLIGLVITTVPQIVWSVWKETRFVGKEAVILYGLSSIGFGFLYWVDIGLDNVIGQEAFALFFLAGLLLLLVRLRTASNFWKRKKSLPFSHKTIGGFQLSFLYYLYVPLIFVTTPEIPTIDAENVLLWGIVGTLVLWAMTGIAYAYKNSSLYHGHD